MTFVIKKSGRRRKIKMLNAEDLKKLDSVRRFVADQGMEDINVDITGVCGHTRVHMTFSTPSSQMPVDRRVSSEDPPQS
jgi:hypothetical protein